MDTLTLVLTVGGGLGAAVLVSRLGMSALIALMPQRRR